MLLDGFPALTKILDATTATCVARIVRFPMLTLNLPDQRAPKQQSSCGIIAVAVQSTYSAATTAELWRGAEVSGNNTCYSKLTSCLKSFKQRRYVMALFPWPIPPPFVSSIYSRYYFLLPITE